MLRPSLKGFALLTFAAATFLHPTGRAEEPRSVVPLVRISQWWANPAVAAIGLPALQGDSVRFATEDAIYEGSIPSVRATVKASSFLPDSVDTWSHFQNDQDRLNYDLPGGEDLVFVGKNARHEMGIYRASANRIVRTWVRSSIPIPEGSGRFQRLCYPQATGDSLVFIGYGENGQKGVYRAIKQTVDRMADTKTRAPGTEQPFTEFTYARVLEDGSVVFTGYTESGSGVYLAKSGQPLRSLLDRRSLEPRTRRPYAGALLVGVEDSWVYFTSFGGSLSIGRVRTDGSSIETVVNEETPLSGQTEKLGAINYVSVHQGRILFEAATHGTEFDLYLWEQGQVHALLRHGQRLEDGTVIGVRCGLEGLSTSHFTCLVDIDTGERNPLKRAVYLGRLPTTSGTGSILGAAPAAKTPVPGTAQFKLGRSPMNVAAREFPSSSSTNLESSPLKTLAPK